MGQPWRFSLPRKLFSLQQSQSTAGEIQCTAGTVQSTTGVQATVRSVQSAAKAGSVFSRNSFSLQWAVVQSTLRSVQFAANVGSVYNWNSSDYNEKLVRQRWSLFILQPRRVQFTTGKVHQSTMRSCSGNSKVCSVYSQGGFNLQPEQVYSRVCSVFGRRETGYVNSSVGQSIAVCCSQQ